MRFEKYLSVKVEPIKVEAWRVEIRPLGPARLGIRPLSTPSVAARDGVWTAPPPTTLLGALGALAGVTLDCPGPGAEAAEEALRRLAQALAVRRIWGPLAIVGGQTAYPTLDGYLVSGEAGVKLRERPARVQRRIGLALAPSKTALPGYLYRAAYLAEEARFVYYIEAEAPPPQGLARLGGEARVALISSGVGEMPEGQVDGEVALLTPLLMPDGELPPCLELMPEGQCPAEGLCKARAVQWGLGFSEVCRERRPMYPALPPGTILRARGCPRNVGYLAELGFGSLADLRHLNVSSPTSTTASPPGSRQTAV